MNRPVTPAADLARAIPAHSGARLDAIQTALTSLANETRRLERIGFELPIARCHEQRRYWSFLHALYSLPDSTSPLAGAEDEARR